MGRKIENRNIDVTKARGELEEDLLVFPKQKDIKKQPMFTCLQTKEYCY